MHVCHRAGVGVGGGGGGRGENKRETKQAKADEKMGTTRTGHPSGDTAWRVKCERSVKERRGSKGLWWVGEAVEVVVGSGQTP
jgi:hypothetical protein